MRTVFFIVTVALCLPVTCGAQTKESTLPAGTLLRCTVDEPKFSSEAAQVGDPLLCHVGSLGMFGQPTFPRGAYLSGRLQGFRDPGHFVGKGSMTLEFDQLSSPDAVLPLPARLVGVRGYRVDREGRILGRGHAKRDAVEWLIPPLWPWKVLSLPARGPRPTLKGETQLTLRLMEDVTIPFTADNSLTGAPREQAPRQVEWELWGTPLQWSSKPVRPSSRLRYAPPSAPAIENRSVRTSPAKPTASFAADPESSVEREARNLTLIALKEGTTYAVTDYWIEGDRLSYTLGDGAAGSFAFEDVDWRKTIQLNARRGTVISLRPRSE